MDFSYETLWAIYITTLSLSFNPMMMVNTSGTCATTRLIQCRYLGISTNDVSRKFQRSPEDAPDLSRDDFLARKKIINQVSRYCDDRARETKSKYDDQYVPILYLYEVSSQSHSTPFQAKQAA